MYGSETWALKKAGEQWIHVFDSCYLHQLLHIKWKDKTGNEDIWSLTQQLPPTAMNQFCWLSWYRNIIWMEDQKVQKHMYQGMLLHGKWSHRCQNFHGTTRSPVKDINRIYSQTPPTALCQRWIWEVLNLHRGHLIFVELCKQKVILPYPFSFAVVKKVVFCQTSLTF